jgi:hypothetical protein
MTYEIEHNEAGCSQRCVPQNGAHREHATPFVHGVKAQRKGFNMTPSLRFDFDEPDGDEELGAARRGSAPELSNRRVRSQQVRKQARSNRSNEVAKRGMHQRRNRRVAW